MVKKLSLKGAGGTALGAMYIMVLLACSKPVNYEGIGDVIKKTGTVEIDYEDVADKMPVLEWSETGTDWEPLNKEEMVTISKGASTPNEITLKVVNSDIYESITWDCDNDDFESGEELVVTAGSAPFGVAKTYHLAVEGRIAGTPYSTYVFIEVGN